MSELKQQSQQSSTHNTQKTSSVLNQHKNQSLTSDSKKNDHEQPVPCVIKESTFNFDNYKFYDSIRIFDHKEYLEQFINEGDKSKDKLRKQMIELVYIQVLNKLKSEFQDLPNVFHQNKTKWCSMLIQTKSVQDLIADFHNKVAMILEKEFSNNKDQLTSYLTHPRPDYSQISSIIGKTNQQSPSHYNKIDRKQQQYHQIIQPQKMLKIGGNIANRSRQMSLLKNKQVSTLTTVYEDLVPIGSQAGKRRNVSMAPGSIYNKSQVDKNIAQQKLEKDLKEVSMMKEEYEKIRARISNIDSLVENMEDNTNDFSQDVMLFQKEIEDLEGTKETNHPLAKLQDLLDRWSQEEVFTDDDLTKFARELWLTVDDFEKNLKESLKGHEIILQMKDHKHSSTIDFIKNKFAFQMDSCGATLIEIKLKNLKENERNMMSMCDVESRLLNYHKSSDELSQLIHGEVKVRTLSEAIIHINELKKVLQVLHMQNKSFEQEKNMFDFKYQEIEDQKDELQHSISEWQQMFKYYQSICLMFAKDITLFDKNTEHHAKFVELNKNDWSKQEEIIKITNEARLRETLADTIKSHEIYKDTIKVMYQELFRLGMIPSQKIPTKKKSTNNTNTDGVIDSFGLAISLSDQDRNKLFDLFDKAQSMTKEQFMDGFLSISDTAPLQTIKESSVGQKVSSDKLNFKSQQSIKRSIGLALLEKKGTLIEKSGNKSKNSYANKKAKKNQDISSNSIASERESKRETISKLDLEEIIKMRRSMDESEPPAELKKTLKLTAAQIQELKETIKQSLNIELTGEQSAQLFDSDVETFFNTLNIIIKQANADQMIIQKQKTRGRGLSESKQSSERKRSSDLTTPRDSLNSQRAELSRLKVPIGDCIQMEYNETGELSSFSIRPKLAQIVFRTGLDNDINSIKEVIKVGNYMNKLLMSEASNSSMIEEGGDISGVQRRRTVVPLRKSVLSQISSDEAEEPDGDFDIGSDGNFSCDQGAQTEDVAQQATDSVMNLLRSHIIDVVCRIAPQMREKTTASVQMMSRDQLYKYVLKNISLEGQEITVLQYLTELMNFIRRKIKDIPPFKRRLIDLKEFFTNIETGNTTSKQRGTSNQMNTLGQTVCMTNSTQSKDLLSDPCSNRNIQKAVPDQEDVVNKYMNILIKEELANTITVLDDFMHQKAKNLATLNLNDEFELFPASQLYSAPGSISDKASHSKAFPSQKVSVAKKFSNTSFHNNYTSFKQKLKEKVNNIHQTMNHPRRYDTTHDMSTMSPTILSSNTGPGMTSSVSRNIGPTLQDHCFYSRNNKVTDQFFLLSNNNSTKAVSSAQTTNLLERRRRLQTPNNHQYNYNINKTFNDNIQTPQMLADIQGLNEPNKRSHTRGANTQNLNMTLWQNNSPIPNLMSANAAAYNPRANKSFMQTNQENDQAMSKESIPPVSGATSGLTCNNTTHMNSKYDNDIDHRNHQHIEIVPDTVKGRGYLPVDILNNIVKNREVNKSFLENIERFQTHGQ